MNFDVKLIKSDEKTGVTVVEVTPVLSNHENKMYAILTLDNYIDTDEYKAKGVARLKPNETWNKEKGERIATAKACRAVRKRMITAIKDCRKWYDKKFDELLELNENCIEDIDEYLKNS